MLDNRVIFVKDGLLASHIGLEDVPEYPEGRPTSTLARSPPTAAPEAFRMEAGFLNGRFPEDKSYATGCWLVGDPYRYIETSSWLICFHIDAWARRRISAQVR